MGIIENIWKFLGKLSLTIWLFFTIAGDLIVGAAIMRDHQTVFSSMERISLPEWIYTYGVASLNITWWLFLLFFLLFILAVNTFVCTTDRVIVLLRKPDSLSRSAFFLRFSPHLMHIGFVLVLAGHLISHTFDVNLLNNIIHKSETIPVGFSNLKMRLEDLNIEFERKTPFESLEGSPKNVSAILSFIDQEEGIQRKVISINRPVWFNGLSFHLKGFYPRSEGSKVIPYVNIIIRKDPGIRFQGAGVIFFCLGLFMYIFMVIQSRLKRGNDL